MANMPQRPMRKAAKVSTDAYANPKPGANKSAYNRQKASNVGKAAYHRKAAGLSPNAQPVGDKDAGNNSYRKKGVNRTNRFAD